MRRTLSYLSSLAKKDNDRWEVQMLGAEFEARSGGKPERKKTDTEAALLERHSESDGAHRCASRGMDE